MSARSSAKGDLGLLSVMVLLAGAISSCACWDRIFDGTVSMDRHEAKTPKRDESSRHVGGPDSVPHGLVRVPGRTGPVDVTFVVHSRRDVQEISPYIYGVNVHCDWEDALERPGLVRLGGNRWTAYNWTNNASNAGSDYNHQNDGWLGGGDVPGEAVRVGTEAAHEAQAPALVTIPITDRVAADKERGGDVARSGDDYLETRFVRSLPRKDGPYSYPPDPKGPVYQDEMIHWLEGTCPHDGDPPIFYGLDNEPALWSTTHPRIRPEPVTYEELIERSITYARAIKDVSADALVFGPVSYGWTGFTTLQDAPDRGRRDFLDTYLTAMRGASKEDGRRLLDVLTVHWYPEAVGGRERITTQSTDPDVVSARVQAPRSLWDPRYTEDSWISRRVVLGPIRLLPRLKSKIEESFPGTRLAITEYNFGGGGHISGGIAQADVLGIFGREGVFAAAVWTFAKGGADYIFGAMNMFRDYDGDGAGFGDRSVYARTSDHVATSVYASAHSDDPNRMVIVALNKTEDEKTTGLRVTHAVSFEEARLFRLVEGNPNPKLAGTVDPIAENAFKFVLPPMSVTTVELR